MLKNFNQLVHRWGNRQALTHSCRPVLSDILKNPILTPSAEWEGVWKYLDEWSRLPIHQQYWEDSILVGRIHAFTVHPHHQEAFDCAARWGSLVLLRTARRVALEGIGPFSSAGATRLVDGFMDTDQKRGLSKSC